MIINKYEIKETMRKARYLKWKEKGKRCVLNKQEMHDILNGKIALAKLMGGLHG